MFFTHFDVLFDVLLKRRTAKWNQFFLYKKETNYYSFFTSKSFIIESRPLPIWAKAPKKSIWRNLLSIQNWLLCVSKSCDWSRQNTPLSNLTQMDSWGKKTYSESRIKLRNLKILRKMLEKSSKILSSEQPCKPKSLDVALNTAGVEGIRLENSQLRRPLDLSFE